MPTKDAIKLSVMLDAVKEIEGKEFLFLTPTSPNCTGEELSEELDRFNKAISKLFCRRNVARVVKGYVRKIEVTTAAGVLGHDERLCQKV